MTIKIIRPTVGLYAGRRRYTMKSITFKTHTVPTGEASADIVEELPEIGDTFRRRTVLEVSPFPLVDEQDDPEVYQYAIWKLRLRHNIVLFAAIHEAEAEKI